MIKLKDLLNEKVISTNKIDSKIWRQMKWDMSDQIDELNKIGQDYGVFQNAQYVSKTLKKIKKLWDTL